MNRILVVGVIILFIASSVIPISGFNIEQPSLPTLRGKTLYVGGSGEGNYSKIQDAIDDASDGDTVFVLDDSQLLPPRKEWSCIYGFYNYDTANSVDQTSDNGYIFTGSGSDDVLLLKTDNKGNEIWSKTFHNKGTDVGHYVQQTNDDGYIIIGGNTGSGGCYDDVLLIKTDNEGNKQWIKTFGGPYLDKGDYGQQTNDSGYVIVGSTKINVTHLDKQIWVIKTDENGNEQWNRTYGGNRSEYGTSIQQTNDNGYIILGITGRVCESLKIEKMVRSLKERKSCPNDEINDVHTLPNNLPPN